VRKGVLGCALAAGIIAPMAALSYEYATVDRWDGAHDGADQDEHGRKGHSRHEHRDRDKDESRSATVVEADATPAAPVEFSMPFAPRVSVADVPAAPTAPATPGASPVLTSSTEMPSIASAPSIAPVVTPSPAKTTLVQTLSPTNSPTPSAPSPVAPSGVHMLDDTGCQAFPSADVFNAPITAAPVDPKSATYIEQAMSHGSGGMGINGPYHYAIVPTGAPMVTVHPTVSYHAFPYAWPIPANGSALANTGDASMILVQQTSPFCTVYDGFSFQDNGGSWSGYSGARVSMGANMVRETCDGVEGLCSEHIEADLTYYEATHGATRAILHVLHGETPSNIGCDPNNFTNCIPIGARLRLHGSYPMPSDANAAAVIQALKTYGFNNADNGCCWNISGLNTLQQPNTYPAPVMAAIGGLRWADFDVVAASD
jgi:hypothetical protein